MSKIVKQARGTILPAGTLPPESDKYDGEIEIVIVKVRPEGALMFNEDGTPLIDPETGGQLIDPNGGKRVYAHCRYPDGFLKEHQVESVPELIVKITNQLRGRHGNEGVQVLAAPAKIAEGGTVKLKV